MAAEEQDQIHKAIQAQAPTNEIELIGWALVAEWRTFDGRRFLSRLGGPETTQWQMKGYLHEGIYGQWLENALPGAWQAN
jgi:hypothetical protein